MGSRVGSGLRNCLWFRTKVVACVVFSALSRFLATVGLWLRLAQGFQTDAKHRHGRRIVPPRVDPYANVVRPGLKPRTLSLGRWSVCAGLGLDTMESEEEQP